MQKNINFYFDNDPSINKNDLLESTYKSFIDIIFESIKGQTIDPQKLIPRFKLTNPEELENYFNEGQSVIIYSQHYNNWEWGPITLGLQIKHHIVGVVKYLSNPYINKYFIKGRSGNNVSVIPTHGVLKYFDNKNDQAEALVFIADQYPKSKTRRHLVNFKGRQIPFHNGAAEFAHKYGWPIFSFDVHKKNRSQYIVALKPICLTPSDHTPQDITQMYATHLEQLIDQSPESWLWSHKRFKELIKY